MKKALELVLIEVTVSDCVLSIVSIPPLAGEQLWQGQRRLSNSGESTAEWPTIVTLGLAFLTRQVLLSLLGGTLSGVALLEQGQLSSIPESLLTDHLLPALQSSWNISVILFTLLMGGFVGLIKHGEGLSGLIRRIFSRFRNQQQGVQWSGCEPLDHVQTQLPYALISGLVALVVGFLLVGLRVHVGIGLALGLLILAGIPAVMAKPSLKTDS